MWNGVGGHGDVGSIVVAAVVKVRGGCWERVAYGPRVVEERAPVEDKRVRKQKSSGGWLIEAKGKVTFSWRGIWAKTQDL
jgi:hypothetical protein